VKVKEFERDFAGISFFLQENKKRRKNSGVSIDFSGFRAKI
jgi:hypothetical protein